ncbi:MAG TPA: MBL fold metallo-hydrolase RNA specificity domain-containing protein [Thermoguttaceae bacterium]|nr:MBL fold metallo-hydrolase RNA specificity domain-containing protein [Thermoguttaceae bacterium]
MFHWENGLKLTRPDLAIDFRRRQPRAFISHAHTDHMARHEYALCTPETSALYQFRLGSRRTLEMPYREPIEWGGLRLTTYPAGHCLGSAMLLAEDEKQSLLYTGDFKLGPSATAPEAELPHADILILESTYGTPEYRLPPREQVVEELCSLVGHILSEGATPVIVAYALGKAQEVTRLLTDRGIPVLQHRKVHDVSRVYEACGMPLGRYERLRDRAEPNWVVVVPPGTPPLESLAREVRIAVTGWAVDERAKYRLRVDHALPLSDHADYDDLFTAVEAVAPKKIYCTHGPASFVDRLCEAGHDAHPLDRPSQRRLF